FMIFKFSRYISSACNFLFFQAEDGIRDRNVTGVQTCALPIFADPDTLEQTPTPSAEEQLLSVRAPDVQEHTKGMPATSATVRLVHASALHELLGLPPLRAWELTPAQRRKLLAAVDVDPQLPARVLAGGASDADRPVPGWIEALWGRWSRDDIDAMAALSSPVRDIPHLLCQAALRPLP